MPVAKMAKKGAKLGKSWGMLILILFCTSIFVTFPLVVIPSGCTYIRHNKSGWRILAAIEMAPKWTVFRIFQQKITYLRWSKCNNKFGMVSPQRTTVGDENNRPTKLIIFNDTSGIPFLYISNKYKQASHTFLPHQKLISVKFLSNISSQQKVSWISCCIKHTLNFQLLQHQM